MSFQKKKEFSKKYVYTHIYIRIIVFYKDCFKLGIFLPINVLKLFKNKNPYDFFLILSISFLETFEILKPMRSLIISHLVTFPKIQNQLHF